MSEIKTRDERRVFSPAIKQKMVQEVAEQKLSAAEIARKYQVNTNQLFRWTREYEAGRVLWVRRAKGLASLPAVAKPPAFLPVNVTSAVSQSPSAVAVTVEFRSGHKLLLHDMSSALLQQLVSALS